MKIKVSRKCLRPGHYIVILCAICITYVVVSNIITRQVVLQQGGSKEGTRDGGSRIERQQEGGVGRQTDVHLDDTLRFIPGKQKTLDLYVVEEHHEVIPYWFSAAKSGVIPTEGNTLIHIDGHSDTAPPQYFKRFPFFTWPTSTAQYKYLMQENDMFIISAAITGLITKIVWVWPTWDEPNHEDISGHDKMDIGWTMVKTNVKGVYRKAFCICALNSTSCDQECLRLDRENQADDSQGTEVDPDECHIERSIIVEEIQETEAAEVIKRSLLYLGHQGTILDIDEDFYGCTYAIRPLLDAGVPESIIEDINDFISDLFCPKNATEELRADRLLASILEELLEMHCIVSGKHVSGHGCFQESHLSTIKSKLVRTIFKKNSEILCRKLHKGAKEDSTVEEMIDLFTKLNNNQMKALREVGFCFSTTPLTFALTSDSKFQICHGANTPNDTAVLEHKTNVTEIEKRTQMLNKILSVVKTGNPNLVTLCRSVRDGYTPREHFTRIENDIINSVRKTIGSVNVVYDSDLLGGSRGWPNRSDQL